MSAATELLIECQDRGIRVVAAGDKLRVAPADAIDPVLLARLRAAKAELLKLLVTASLHYREEDEVEQIARTSCSQSAGIPAAVATEIKRIESQALGLGWRSERLWNFHFWPHCGAEPRGLASVIDPGDRVVEVSRELVLIEKSNSQLRFWRTDG